jgi:lantibiotic modifying enzyme
VGGDARALAVAKKGAEGIRVECKLGEKKPFFYNPSYCCGSAGCLDAMVSLYEASKEPKFLEDARRLADATLETMRIEKKCRVSAAYDDVDQEAKKHPYYETGFMLGNSGIGYALLRLSAVSSGKADRLLHFPDQPFAHGKPSKASGR